MFSNGYTWANFTDGCQTRDNNLQPHESLYSKTTIGFLAGMK